MAKPGIKDLKGFQRKLDKKLVKNPEKHLKGLVQDAVRLVEGTVLESLQSGGTGITYQKYNPRREHTASAKRQPPATDLGGLVSSVSTQVRKEGTAVVGKIIAAAPYAPYLEFGTATIVKRPFLQPALERNRPRIKRKFKEGGYTD